MMMTWNRWGLLTLLFLFFNYRKQQGHYCLGVLAMLAEWEE